MIVRYFYIFSFFLGFLKASTQDIALIGKEIEKIDKLIVYNQYKTVESKSDSLYNIIKNSGLREQILKLKLQKAIAIDSRNEHGEALPLYQDILAQAEKYKFYSLACEANIWISLIHEKNGDFDLAVTYIRSAREMYTSYNLEKWYSTILIRLASIHRVVIRLGNNIAPEKIQQLENIGFKANLDSTLSLAKTAILFAQKYNNAKDINDCNFLIGACYSYLGQDSLSIEYFKKTIPYSKEYGNIEDVSFEYNNISRKYLQIHQPLKALVYSDSAYLYYDKMSFFDKYLTPFQRSEIYKSLQQPDSAYLYLSIAFGDMSDKYERQKNIDTKKLEEEFQNAKKVETIKSKNRQLLLSLGLLGALVAASISSILKNKKINAQNKIISQQVQDLKKTIDQKQILLSELQHRVKNNLQYVISILEIQKESVNFNTIEELIRSNQNRIHSIALLHKKLNVNDSVHDVELNRYITELSELVKESYAKDNKVKLMISCELENLSITKALPLGLIIVELISNSMKHAFETKSQGVINIEITRDTRSQSNKLVYMDNGIGVDIHKIKTNGLGLEIIHGLVSQLNATMQSPYHTQGFECIIHFNS
jgi:two-component sensor histidine kinase